MMPSDCNGDNSGDNGGGGGGVACELISRVGRQQALGGGGTLTEQRVGGGESIASSWLSAGDGTAGGGSSCVSDGVAICVGCGCGGRGG